MGGLCSSTQDSFLTQEKKVGNKFIEVSKYKENILKAKLNDVEKLQEDFKNFQESRKELKIEINKLKELTNHLKDDKNTGNKQEGVEITSNEKKKKIVNDFETEFKKFENFQLDDALNQLEKQE